MLRDRQDENSQESIATSIASEATDVESTAEVRGMDSGRMRRLLAVLLSLAAPGYGHLLLGKYRRGFVWVLVASLLAFLVFASWSLYFLRNPSPSAFAVSIIAVLVGKVGAAIDASRFVPVKHPWKIVLVAWIALLAVNGLIDSAVSSYYIPRSFQAFSIPATSMEPTLLPGDRILSDNSFFRSQVPQRGDLIVLRYPLEPSTYFIKRVIGVPGDRIRLKEKRVYRNDALLDEPFVIHDSPELNEFRDNFPDGQPSAFPSWASELHDHVKDGNVVVPPDAYFVMGDNRDFSSDSRYWGFVLKENIVGKPVTIYWSFEPPSEEFRPIGFSGRLDELKDSILHFPQRTRWNRIFRPIP